MAHALNPFDRESWAAAQADAALDAQVQQALQAARLQGFQLRVFLEALMEPVTEIPLALTREEAIRLAAEVWRAG